ncbi:cytochrome P450 oxidoreductase GliC [Penicillium psychrosexuale]|uniref:cytochrome P450 oxidoreductase GliC n=1 Tax=Penicillium psychrosexuale TaxID=1002107 RepID=UPI00254590E8|nr:cytochrome P450 oxidoreductase GliC [Penicillium psychrosexuale]KAJ5789837.1 cytochrome P450 oxidoreductase GliC [Penicillium psychrosexuale]
MSLVHVSLILVLTVLVWRNGYLAKTLNTIISAPINAYLCWKNPVKSLNKSKKIPTCPFQLPNGQGNVKFAEGRAYSRKWASSFGQIYRIWAGTTPEVVLTRQEHMPVVFKDSHLHVKSFNFDAGWLFGELVGKAVGLLSGQDWNRVRDVFASSFHRTKVDEFLPFMQRRVKQCLDELHESPKVHADGVLTISPADDLRLLSFWVLCDILYGDMTPDMEANMLKIVDERERVWANVTAGGLSRLSIGRYLPIASKRTLKLFRSRWYQFNRQACNRARHELNGIPPVCAYYDAVEREELTEREMLDTMDEILFANLDVTIGSLSWVLIFMATHSKTQAQLREEIVSNSSDDSPEIRDKYISESSTLLMACLLESARLRPIASFSGAQSPPTDRQVGSYVIPGGMNVTVDIHGLNIDDPSWGDDRDQFNPRRFLDAKNPSVFRYRLWRFGFGPRQCLGKYLADLFLKTLLAHIVENYRIEMKDASPVSLDDLKGNSAGWINLATEDVVWVPIN